VLCDVKAPLIDRAVNSQPQMVKYNIFNILRNYMLSMGCSFHTALETDNFVHIIKGFDSIVNEVPTVRMTADIMKDLSRRIDRDVRKNFADIMLYNTPAAAEAKIAEFSYLEVDERAFLSNSTWTAWMRSEIRTLSKRRWIRNCHHNAGVH